MNYWRRYIADILSKTVALTMIEDGAYTRLLDWYYEHEKPLPLGLERVYTIARAMKPPERKAVDHVLASFFTKAADGWHNKRADEELAEALPALENLRRVARENGAKGGRPRKPNPVSDPVPKPEPEQEPIQEPEPEPDPQPNPEPSSQPLREEPKPLSKKRFPDDNYSSASAGTLGAAALAGLKSHPPVTLEAARIPGGEDTPAAALAAILRANSVKGNAFHPLVVEWSREGITPDRLKAAIAKARQRPGKETGTFGPEYLDPILHDTSRPAAEVIAERGRDAAGKSLEKTRQVIEEGQRAKEVAVGPPDDLMQQYRRLLPG